MRRRPLLAAGGWLAAAALTTVAGLAAVRVIGEGITSSTGADVLTPREAARQLASASALPSPAADPAPGPSGSSEASGSSEPSRSSAPSGSSPEVSPSGAAPPASTASVRKVVTSPGGTVVAECHGTLVTLKSWAPAQGYGVKKAEPGPDEHAEVSFEGGSGRVEIRWRCADGRPVASWRTDD
ncbi:hypothetical protein ABT026_18335 [Streptomyces sp. NPDC002734]|uniref:hypothetical protein n=1 Tax=Streptomyces sp. NPDC002734 TaxID=3154426 RepID=UPI0033174736